MNFAIRRAREADLPVITRMLTELGSEPQIPEDRALALYRRIRRHPGYHIHLATVDGEPAGTFSLFVIPTLLHDGACEALVDGVVVTSRYRNRGIGKMMMDAAMGIAAQAGCYKLALSSNLRRKDAHRFYLDLGFRQHGFSFHVDLRTPD